jgi:hypothetical protein
MVRAEVHIDYGSWFQRKELKVDGSDFIDWFQHFRGMLYVNNILYVIEEPLGDAPGPLASEEDRDEFRTRRDTYIEIQVTMCSGMVPELQTYFEHTSPMMIIEELRMMFHEQVKLGEYECMDEFLSMKMEENTCLKTHLERMHDLHKRVVDIFDYYWMTDTFAIKMVLRSLPPSYKEFVHEHVKKGELSTFHAFVMKLRNVKVEPIAGEIIDEGIFDILVINVSHTTFDAVY